MARKVLYVVGLLMIVLLAACKSGDTTQITGRELVSSEGITLKQSVPTPALEFPAPLVTPIPTIPAGPSVVPKTGTGSAPYGSPPPVTAEELYLTQKLFALINSDRAVRGLYPYKWNNTLSGGARLHVWNMYHCGFSHTCPDGHTPCQRIANEGFAGYTDCGECIAYAGPYPTPWDGVYRIQESMIHEPPTGWHRIYLTSKTLHRVGVGIYVDPAGYIWITEDLVS